MIRGPSFVVRLHGHLVELVWKKDMIAIKEALLTEEDPEVRAELEKAMDIKERKEFNWRNH